MDRTGKKYNIFPLMLKDIDNVRDKIGDIAALIASNEIDIDTIKMLLPLALQEAPTDDMDIRTAKMIVYEYLGLPTDTPLQDYRPDTVIQLSDGRKWHGYSYKLNDYNKAMKLMQQLSRIDLFSINFSDDYSEKKVKQKAVQTANRLFIDLIFECLDRKVDKKTIRKSLDLELVQQCISIFFDLSEVR